MNRNRLRQFIEDETPSLTRTLGFYLSRAGLTDSASELLNDVVVEALKHEDRFNPTRQPRAWLLGIAANLIHRKQTELARLNRREPLARDLYPGDEPNDDDLFDWFVQMIPGSTAERYEIREEVNHLLAGVSEDDAQILRLALMYGLDGEALARELGITPGAARVRLHRAMQRMRRIVQAEKERSDE